MQVFLLALALGLLWSSAFPMITVAGQGLPVFTIVALRLVVAAAMLVVWRWWKTGRWSGYERGCFVPMLVLAILGNNLPFTMIIEGQRHITSGEAALIIAMVPSISMLIAPLVLADEPFRKMRILGTVTGLAGVGLLLLPHWQQPDRAPFFAYLLVGLTALSYGAVHVAAKYYSRYSSLDRATGSLLLSAILSIPPALLLEQPWALDAWPLPATFASIGLGIFPSAIASLLFFYVATRYGTIVTGFAGYCVPVFGVLFGALFFAESLTLHVLGAMALILAGMAVARK